MEWFGFALGSAIFSALAVVIEKKTLLKEKPIEFSTVFSLFTLLISFPLIFFAELNIPLSILAILYIGSVFNTIAYLHVAKALRHMEVSITSPLLSFQPAVLVFLAFLILGEELSFMQLLGILILVICAYILEIPKHLDLKEPIRVFFKSKYIHYIFLAIILYGFSSIIDKFVISYITPVTYILVMHFFIMINFLFLISFHSGLKGVKNGIRKARKLILIVAFLAVAYRLLQIQAVSMTFVSLVIPIKKLNTLFSTIIGGELFHEKRVFLRTMVAGVMLFGSYLIITG